MNNENTQDVFTVPTSSHFCADAISIIAVSFNKSESIFIVSVRD